MSLRISHGLAVLTLLLAFSNGTVAVAGKPDPVLQQLDFGVEMAKLGLWNEALFRFKQADQLKPGSSRVLNNLAVAYEALGQFDRALEYYQQAVQAGGNTETRQNYSRFVEFYRNFKPDGGEAEEAEETEAANDATDVTAESSAADSAPSAGSV